MRGPIHYDIIGDVHGRFDKLSALMGRLSYVRAGERFVPPPNHRTIFVGDLIDPKPGHPMPGGTRATLRAVKAMTDHGDAFCVMGNHELNAVFYHTRGPDGKWLRTRGSKNRAMHKGTLEDFPDHEDPAGEWLGVWLPWMKRLPFHLDLGGLRVVHATWHPEMIARINGASLDDHAFLLAGADKATPEAEALEILLKGIEVPLPRPHRFTDHTGVDRAKFRARWWCEPKPGLDCSDLVFPPNPHIPAVAPGGEASAGFRPYAPEEPPVFFGHYYKPADAPLEPEADNVACLDHGAAMSGPLLAYRWKGEPGIKPDNYVTHA